MSVVAAIVVSTRANVQTSVASSHATVPSTTIASRVPNAAPKNSAMSALTYSHVVVAAPISGPFSPGLTFDRPTAAPSDASTSQMPRAIRNPAQTPLQATRATGGASSTRVGHRGPVDTFADSRHLDA